MGEYCTRATLPRHAAKLGELMEVRRLASFQVALVGDKEEIACIPHKGCRIEIVATAETTHPLVDLLLPGHVIRYKRSFFFGDRFELPTNATIGLDELIGFTLQLAPSAAPMPPAEELIVERARQAEERVPAEDAAGPGAPAPSRRRGGALARLFPREPRR